MKGGSKMRVIEGKVYVTEVDDAEIGDVDAGAGQDTLTQILASDECKGQMVRVTIEISNPDLNVKNGG
jgi:hypothetical protein